MKVGACGQRVQELLPTGRGNLACSLPVWCAVHCVRGHASPVCCQGACMLPWTRGVSAFLSRTIPRWSGTAVQCGTFLTEELTAVLGQQHPDSQAEHHGSLFCSAAVAERLQHRKPYDLRLGLHLTQKQTRNTTQSYRRRDEITVFFSQAESR